MPFSTLGEQVKKSLTEDIPGAIGSLFSPRLWLRTILNFLIVGILVSPIVFLILKKTGLRKYVVK